MSETLAQTALVTGGTGFIGRHLVRRLGSEGWEVHLLRRPGTAAEPVSSDVTPHPYTGRTEDVLRAFEQSRPDVVFHLASLFVTEHAADQITPLFEANILLGTQVLEAMHRTGTRHMVNAGTAWQHYHTTSYRPVNLYAATKQAFEDILTYYADAADLRAVTLLLYDTYGPADPRRKLLRLLTDCLDTGEELGLSPGEQVLDLTHVNDVCGAFLHAAALVRDPAQPAQAAYAVSGGDRVTLCELVRRLEQTAGRRLPVRWGARAYRKREVMQLWDGPPLPGWRPRLTLEEGLRELVKDSAGSSAIPCCIGGSL